MGENPCQKSWSAMKSSQRDQRDHCVMWLFAGYLQFNENFLTFCLYRSVNMNGIVPTASPSNSMHFWQPMKSYWKTGCVKKVVLNFITELYESRINQSINLLLIIICLFVCLFCFNLCSEVNKAVKANPDNSYSANIRNYQLVLLGGGRGSQTKEWWCSSV